MSTIRGSVFQDINGDGVFDLGEGLRNVTVFLDQNGNGVPDPGTDTDGDGIPEGGELTTLTDDLGEYTFTNLPQGTFTLDQVTPAGFNEPVGVPLSLATTGDPNERIDVNILNVNPTPPPTPVATTGVIRGAVYVDNNRNQIYEPFGELGEPTLADGFPGAIVYIDLNNSGFRELSEPFSEPNEAGFYFFGDLLPGSYLLRTELPGGFEVLGDNPIVAPVAAATVNEVDIPVIDPDSVYGRVIRDLNGDGQPQPFEPGQAGIDIDILDGDGNVSSVTTDDDGFYIFSNLDTSIPGADDPQNPFAQFIEREEPERFARGFILDFGNNLPSSAYVFTSPVPPVGLVPGEIGATIPPDEARQVNSTLVFNAAGITPVPNSISGVVFNDLNANSLLDVDPLTGLTDEVVEGATVYLDLDEDGQLGDEEPSTTTDFNGNFIFRNLPPTLPIDPVTGLASLEESYILRVEPTDDLENVTTPIPAYTLDFGEAAQGTLGLSNLEPFPPENQFAQPGGGINPDPIRVRGFDPLANATPAPIVPTPDPNLIV
ncbi:hypothetical protein ACL6C3_07170 [Capilliphycus salinus ALCB114379]|uniref:hypothetical protein n=1 Tax=Capilliphycus salinus TaxID=2768948 RepID=UPI0039A44E84